MHLLCVGISHRTASVELREKLALNDEQAADLLAILKDRFPKAELSVVSTCNRTELYIARPLHGHPRVDEIVNTLAGHCRVTIESLENVTFHHDGPAAMQHLFRVTSGLDSMVLGENQIVTQIKHAYELAQSADTAGRSLHRMFQSAMSVSKSVRTQTGISTGRVSVGSVAVTFARHLFHDLHDKTLLMLAAGKMGELTLRHFMDEKPGRLVICNRSPERATQLAETFGGEAVGFDDLANQLVAADVVVTSTGASEPIVTKELFKPLVKRRKRRPLFVIDIAVPRDFEPSVGDYEDVFLYNLDDLQQAIADSHDSRREEVEACEAIIRDAVETCYNQIQSVDFAQLIRQLRDQLHELGNAESERTRNRLLAADPADHDDIIEEHSRRLINKILHRPLNELGNADSTQAAMYATALRRLFDLDISEDLTPPESQTTSRRIRTDATPTTPAPPTQPAMQPSERSES